MHPDERPPITPEQLEEYRRMSISEKMALTLRMTEAFLAALHKEPPEAVERWYAERRREKDESNRNMLERLARANKSPPEAERHPTNGVG